MRVISGKIRGKKLYSLEGDNTRPTTDRVKENIFNIIAGEIYDANVLDLFAGSGALGIEALSRGAAFCDFVEKNVNAFKVVLKNISETPFLEQCKNTMSDYLVFLQNTDKVYDIIFLDPPYEAGYYIPALEKISDRGLLSGGGIIVVERKTGMDIEYPQCFEIIKDKKYGHVSVSILKIKED